jgi:two-component system sensor histidine kinase KdpD
MLPVERQRPDPDALLTQVQAQERRTVRGKLRIYFGASAGVGKTYAMLAAGRKLRDEGQDVLVGVLETHGRSETAALLEGLSILPLKTIVYRGKSVSEFDIDGALNRRPALILVDELAHSNIPGSRHPKRWQDVHELLDAGVDVFTTLNVQHLESLNDVVGGITGVRVSETLPDTVFDEADEVVLIDLPADELLARLKAGKVYQLPQAEHASRNFFRKGNIIALRELALRRTADRVEDDVKAYRIEKSIGTVWKTDAAILACLGPRPGGEHIIRSAAMLATQLSTDWHAIYIETPQLQRLPSAHRERILKTLQLAESLGAKTAVLAGDDIAQEIVNYARGQNFSRIILGHGHPSWPWRRPHLRRIAALAPDIDLTELGLAATKEPQAAAQSSALKLPRTIADKGTSGVPGHRPRHWQYAWAGAAILLTALIAAALSSFLDLANIIMLFLLAVVLIATRYGRGPAVLATALSVAIFDFFFVPPRFSFEISDAQYLVTFAVMLAVGLITAHLTSNLRFQARIATHREARSRALYEFSRELSGALQTEQILNTTCTFIVRTFGAKATLLLPDNEGRLQLPLPDPGKPSTAADISGLDTAIAQWAFDHATPAGIGTDTLPGSKIYYLPLIAPMRTRGVLAILPKSQRWILIPEQRQQLDTFAALAAIALERMHYIEVAQDALVHMESERLRNSLLAALSHDLRTPLTAIVGLSESLAMSKSDSSPKEHEFAIALHDEALRMSNLVTNLLDMARIQSGEIRLNLQWQPLEEVVGSALRASQSFLARHKVQVRLDDNLPLIHFDAILIERVLGNLLENASKYTPTGSQISITAQASGQDLVVCVYDDGPGLPPGKEEAIFEKFTRGERESATPGVGLGLAICRAIVQAHGGTIRAGRSPEGGALIVFTLPLGDPPALPPMSEADDEPVAPHDPNGRQA